MDKTDACNGKIGFSLVFNTTQAYFFSWRSFSFGCEMRIKGDDLMLKFYTNQNF